MFWERSDLDVLEPEEPPARHVADVGFHDGELAVQRQAGVERSAARLGRMLEAADLAGGPAAFLGDRTFLVLTARGADGRRWVTALVGPPGFLEVRSPTELVIHAAIPPGDALHGLPAGQEVGMIAVEFAARRRLRINGVLAATDPDRLVVRAEQVYGNCPQHIHRRRLVPAPERPAGDDGEARRSTTLSPEDLALVRAADTFFLGTANPGRGADASHRGGPAGFLRADERALWWPDHPGNDLFNSFGNLAVDPEAALLVADFRTGRTVQLSGSGEVEWGAVGRPGDDGHTGRIVRFRVDHVVSGCLLGAREAGELG